MKFRTDGKGWNAWHIAAFGGEVDVMQKNGSWLKRD